MRSSQTRHSRKIMIVPHDELIVIPDYDLERRIRNAKNSLTYKPDRNSRDVQIELCYLQRESEIREARKNAHEVYLRNLRNNRR